jgi:hypothetical protein
MADAAAPFVPPHCPRSDCRFHHCVAGWRWKRHGSFTRQAAPRRIPRFRCGHCGHTFSSQSFATSYWLVVPPPFPQPATASASMIAAPGKARRTTAFIRAPSGP